jgi:histidinol-phosphatase (PHP family)
MNAPLPADTHIHTALCLHAEGMPLDYARAAFAKGLPEICITDHIPAPDGYDADSRMTPADYPAYREAVAEAARAFPDRVRLGIEADYYPGCETYLSEFLASKPFDLVLGSVHFIGDWGFDNPANLDRWEKSDVRAIWGQYLVLVRRMAERKWFDVVSHFDLPKKFGHRLEESEVRELAAPALDAIAESGMAVELNTGGWRKPVKEIYPSLAVLAMIRERGIPILFGSDAHAPAEVGFGFAEAVALARQAGFTSYVRFKNRVARAFPLPPGA